MEVAGNTALLLGKSGFLYSYISIIGSLSKDRFAHEVEK